LNSNYKVISTEKIINLPSVKFNYKYTNSFRPNLSFGTLDLETYDHLGSNTSKVYALGYYFKETEESEIFYINKDLDSDELIHSCINTLLNYENNNRILYVHNLGGYDSVFIIKALMNFNQKSIIPYNLNPIIRDGSIIKLTISREIKGKIKYITLMDSMCILPFSLRALSEIYGVLNKKTYFPYSFVNENTLFYTGDFPTKDFYPTEVNNKIYFELKKKNSIWDMKNETLSYLKNDLMCLHEILSIVIKRINLLFKVDMTDSLTISSLAIKIFDKMYNNKHLIPNITDPIMYKSIKKAYYGGRFEIYKPQGKNLYYYDVNSLYPYSSLNPLCGLKAKYVKYSLNFKEINIDN